VLSSWIVNSGLSEKFGKFFSKICEFVFFLPGSAAAVIILSFIGGYPAGANGISDLRKNNLINDEQAGRMALFAFGAGPAFVISVIGGAFLKNERIAGKILSAQILSSVLIGIFLGLQERFHGNLQNLPKQTKTQSQQGNALIKSCEEAALAMINMCSLVIFFSVLNSYLKNFGICAILGKMSFSEGFWNAFLSALTEVTQGCHVLAGTKNPIPAIAMAAGFGGLCVHCQIFSILKEIKIPYFKFLAVRLIHGTLAAFFTFLFTLNFKSFNPEPFDTPTLVFGSSLNIIGSLFLFLCCVYILIMQIKSGSAKYDIE
jgi:sporulation integral membrane protein YlbJ